MAANAAYQPLVLWKPVPSDSTMFTSLGYCVTENGQPPELSSVRCVPLKWTRSFKESPLGLWRFPSVDAAKQPCVLALSPTLNMLVLGNDRTELRGQSFALQRETVTRSDEHGSERTLTSKQSSSTNFFDRSHDLLSGDTLTVPEANASDTVAMRIPQLVPRKTQTTKSWF